MQKTRSLGILFVLAALVAGAWWLLGGGGDGGLGGDPAAAGKEAEGAAAALQVDGRGPAPATLETSGDRVAITPAQASDASGPAIVGCVVDAASKPVAGARVRCTPSAANSFDGDVDFSDTDAWVVRARELAKQRVEVQTGDDGRFRVAASGAAATFELQVLARGHVAHSQSVPRPKERDYDAGTLKLKGAAVLSGRVVDRAGKAIAGATVQREGAQEAAGDMDFDNPWAAEWTELTAAAGLVRTDAEGRFELAHAEPGEFALSARHPDYPTARLLNLKAAPGAVLTDLVITVEPGTTIRGKVVGAPAETSGLRVVAGRKRDSSQPREGLGLPVGEQEYGERGSNPASDGTFTLRGVTPGRTYRVWLTQRGRGFTGPGTCSQKLEVSGGAEGIELRYDAGVTVTLQVADARSGAPVERLWVSDRLKGSEGFPVFGFDMGATRARDYPGGKVTLANLRPAKKQTLSLSVEAIGFKKFEREGIELPLTGSVDLGLVQLQPVPVVRVQVTAALDAQPVAGATVSLSAKGRPERGDLEIRRMFEGNAMVRSVARSVKTDAEGRCTLNSIPGAEVVVSVTTKDFAPYASAPLTLPAADDVEHAVRLVPGGAVAVEVVDTEGKPVAKATVAHADAAERRDSLQADAQGLVVFERLLPGEHRFRLGDAAMGFDIGNGMFKEPVMVGARSLPPSPRTEDWRKVAVLDGARATLRLVKPLTATVTGIVRENGVPLVGADVALVRGVDGAARPEMERFRGGARARTDELGRYTLNEAPMGDHRLRVTHRDRAMPATLPVTLVAGANAFDVALDVAIVRGVVRSPDGKPLAGASVRAAEPPDTPASGARQDGVIEAMMRAEGGDGGRGRVRTDAEGRYELRGVASSKSIVVRASAKGFSDAASAPFQVALGGTRESVDVALAAAGTVRVKAAEDIAFASVQATFTGGEANVAPVQAMVMRGAATLEGLRPGSWKVTLNVPGRPEPTSRTVEVKGGATVEAVF